MRFIFAIICFVLAAAAIGLGIAERTVLAGPDHASAQVTMKTPTPLVVIDGAALNAYPHTQTVRLVGGKTAFAAYGRTPDVVAWAGSTTYTRISFDHRTNTLVAKVHTGKTSVATNPAGSDLWLAQYTGASARDIHLNVPSEVSMLVASDGRSAAPHTVKMSWPLENTSPLAGVLITTGAVLLLLGLILLAWAFLHLRRSRGPRRNQPKMPRLPRRPRYKARKQSAIGPAKGRRSIQRFVATVPGIALASVVLVGCGALPATTQPTLTPTSTATGSSSLPETAVTPGQLQHIVERISQVTTKADSTLDSTLIGSRLAGPALDARTANYAVRKVDATVAALPSIPAGNFLLTLPEAKDGWPRTVFTVVQAKAESKIAPLALILIQDTPRANYKVNYAISLQPKAVLPQVASVTVGATRISPDSKLLRLPPNELAAAYGDILLKDTASSSYSTFDAEGDSLRKQVGLAAKNQLVASLPTTASMTFSNAPGTGQVVALATNSSGALVAVDLVENVLVKPVKAGASVSAQGAVKALAGVTSTATGITSHYGDQLLFYVPRNQSGRIVLLGYSADIVSASEVK